MHFLLREIIKFMHSLTKILVGLIIISLPIQSLFAQNQRSYWEVSTHNQTLLQASTPMKTLPTVYHPFQLSDKIAFEELLQKAPTRFSIEAENLQNDVVISLPMPDGSTAQFKVLEFSVMAKRLAKKFPNIRSYTAFGIDDPSAIAKIDMTPKGFHAMIRSAGKSTIYVDPLVAHQNQYMSYYRKDFPIKGNGFECHVEEVANEVPANLNNSFVPVGDCQFRQYRLALACTGEYAAFHDDDDITNGDITSDVMAAMVTTMNRVNGVFEKDAGITMEIVENNDQLIFTDGNTDPYTNGSGSAMLGQNQTTCDNIIGTANYDIGHVFSTGGGGIASLRSPCSNNRKAQGVTGQGNPIGDPFDIDYVAHEMGHQFGGNHTQNNNCQRSGASVEPGSASTIMGYAGICSPNVQNNSDDYFHGVNLLEFANFVTGSGNCAAILSSSNGTPTADAGNNYTIPIATPFELTAVGTDPDGDPITYCWEQMDHEAAEAMPPEPSNTQGPTFRSLDPTIDPVRVFPNMASLLSGATNEWEVLPGVSRVLDFRVSVRDNNSVYGCAARDNMEVTTTTDAGPFVVTYPTTTETWIPGESKTLTWDVADTDLAPVSCSQVDILISTDGGGSFADLATNQANNGSYDFIVPDLESEDIRFKIICSNNIFFTVTPAPINIGFTETCTVFNSTDIPITISASETPLITSDLVVNLGSNITNVKVINLTGDHTFTGDLDFTLIHPNGQEIDLLNDQCGNNDNFNLEVSDDGGAVTCPLSNQQTIAPTDALSGLNGLPANGTWVLQIQDDADQDGGVLNSWGLEICANVPLSSLPVELIEFAANPKESHIALAWETANEIDNAGFEIHRSTLPNRGFESIGWVEGFGTNNGNKYYFDDEDVVVGQTYYYQLKQIDYDEKFEFSKIVSAKLIADELIIGIRPNPVASNLTLTLSLEGNHTARIAIIDLLGRTILETTPSFQDFQEENFELSYLSKGVYLLNIELENGEQIVQKFIKE